MREILFRGKRLDNGEWVMAGNLIHFNEDNLFYITKQNDKCIHLDDVNDNILQIEEGTFYKVDPATVGQYTGLTDKNGTKIFEGDIVKDAYILGEVIYNTKQEDFDGAASFMIDDVDDGLQSYRFWNSVEVIGNIHDNYELLEGGAEMNGGPDNGTV